MDSEIPEELRSQLDADRELIIDPDTGHVMRREAWERINATLDQLNDLARIALEADIQMLDLDGLPPSFDHML